MTKKEKIAISVSAILGFAAFCIALIPVSFLLGYVFGEQTCFVGVEYDKLPYAMGEDFVYVPLTFWNEQDYELSDTVSIMYNGKWGKYNDSNFETPIPKTWEYYFDAEKRCGDENGGEYFARIEISCSRVNMNYYDKSSYNLTCGQYKYKLDSQIEYEGGVVGYILEYDVCVIADSGNICNLSVRFHGIELVDESLREEYKSGLKYQKIFENLLDSLVGYSYFIENT